MRPRLIRLIVILPAIVAAAVLELLAQLFVVVYDLAISVLATLVNWAQEE